MSFNLGIKALRRLCEQQDSHAWFKALFKPNELPIFEWVDNHIKNHHALPQIETLSQKFPEIMDAPVPEPASYYVEQLENAYYYTQVNLSNVETSKILKENNTAWEPALTVMRQTINRIMMQRYRTQVMDFGAEAKDMLLATYHNTQNVKNLSQFGWPYMDLMGGAGPGDVVSFIGRPQAGKSFLTLYTGLENWLGLGHSVLFVSMEMSTLPVAQRAAAMVAGTNLTQLKQGQYSTFSLGGAPSTYDKFIESLNTITTPVEAGGGRLYIVNGNLAADIEEIYMLADQLGCATVIIDGAYLCRNKNAKLDRFTRAAENVEQMKRHSEDMQVATFSSWQFNRVASQKKDKGGKGGTIDDIGYSDAIGQISSIVLGLFQEDGVETMNKKTIRVLKGRGGEVGEFDINWDFNKMNFDQIGADGESWIKAAKIAEDYI
jgi:hypothetical protein